MDNGACVADVAARFDVTETVVARRMKLGRLSPVILAAYRESEIGLDQAQAFTVTDDHAAQERVLADLPEWNRDPGAIRRALTVEEIPTTDRLIAAIEADLDTTSIYVETDLATKKRALDTLDRGRSGRKAAGWSRQPDVMGFLRTL